MPSPFDGKFGNKGFGYGIGPKGWRGRLATAAMILVAGGAALAATRLSDLPRWIPLIVVILTLAVTNLLVSVTHEGDGE